MTKIIDIESIFVIAVVVFVVVLLVGLLPYALYDIEVTRKEARATAQAVLGGEHQLKKMTTRAGLNGRISGSYFLFGESVSGSLNESSGVTFSWPLDDGTYAISTLPVEMIRVKIDQKADVRSLRRIRHHHLPCRRLADGRQVAVERLMTRLRHSLLSQRRPRGRRFCSSINAQGID